MKYFILVLLCILSGTTSFAQSPKNIEKETQMNLLLDSLWVNPTSFFNNKDTNWRLLCSNLQHINLQKLNQITDSIYRGTDVRIENETIAFKGVLGSLNKSSHEKKVRQFEKKIKNNFTNKTLYPNNKVILVEGDSWFEFPVFLNEITDDLMKEDNLAIYSLASGGDWFANMISSGDYQSEYSRIKPDVFIISGGGNDIVGENRLIKFVTNQPIGKQDAFLRDFREYVALRQNHQAVPMCTASFCPIEYHAFADSMTGYYANIDTASLNKIVNGRRYIHKNFYRWLVTFKLEYKILIESLRKIDPAHFDSLKIITQGYDYPIPSSTKKFGIRLFMHNGKWLKNPLKQCGITDQYTRESIVMALMFDFNEMLIELGKEYANIYHVDVRAFTHFLEINNRKQTGTYWYDELHPVNLVFKEISQTYIAIINDQIPKSERVVNVIDFFKNNNN